MHNITQKDLKALSKLACIHLEEKDSQGFIKELPGILDWIDKLKAINTTGVSELEMKKDDYLRERNDEITSDVTMDDLLDNAPSKKQNMFSVPKVIE
ncbi:MAG: Asp-tRNA(Asn)/Glu-tRNA(Gln) amidotransferase subunit GatC [Alphaproteobacteria bacterium]